MLTLAIEAVFDERYYRGALICFYPNAGVELLSKSLNG